ncbi:MAG: CoB--CoM heterodisulfide reductase iron-sulfur subunit B family protein [Chloroflexi bacterium]|nr:CoB--CoM heterodisulfide reductase iron-sulfur subunit B family protein [Chloroflexota bacterium]
MKYLFYPGCSMERSARSYLDSLLAIQEELDMDLEEIHDWNCCGATEYLSVSLLPAYALIARNLALAARQTDGQTNGARTVMAGCSACYLNLAKTDHYMGMDPTLSAKVNQALAAGGLQYTPGSVQVRHLLDVMLTEVGLDKIRSRVVRPLQGLRLAAYYGCMVPRPDYDHRFSNHEYPTELEQLLKALGAEVIDFPLKTHCCGGHMPQISQPVAFELIRRLIHGASEYRADMLVTLCPMCQLNLDAYQAEVNRYFQTNYHMPVVFFTQMVGLAFGKDPKALGFGKEFVDVRPALARIGLEIPAEAEKDSGAKPAPRKSRQAKEGLPMPQMPGIPGIPRSRDKEVSP